MGLASITRRCAFTATERDEARLADGDAAEPVELLRACRRRIGSTNRRHDRVDDSVVAREQPARGREQHGPDEDPAQGGRDDAEQDRTTVRVVQAVDRGAAPARVGDLHHRNGDACERDGRDDEERAGPPAGRSYRARTAIAGRLAAKPESA